MCDFHDEMNIRRLGGEFQSEEDTSTENAQGIAKVM